MKITINRIANGVALGLVLICSACNRDQANKQDAPPPGRAEETWKFWEAFNTAATSGTGVEALKSPVYSENVGLEDTCVVLEDIIAGEQSRIRAITSLAVLHVDPDLAAYSVSFTKARGELVSAMQDYVTLAKKQEEMTSMPVLGVGLFFNLLNHADDNEDGILWRVLIDQTKQTANELQTLRTPAKAFEAKAVSVRHAGEQLKTEEMSVRVKLAQRFNREFPAFDSYAATADTSKQLNHLDEKGVMQTLVGQRTGEWPDRWNFDSLQEFVTFKIVSVTKRSETLSDYEVRTHVKGIPSGKEHDFKLRLKFGRLYTRWKLIEIQQLP